MMIKKDSRQISRGDTFVCITHPKALEHCLQAIDLGANTLIVEQDIWMELTLRIERPVQINVVPNARKWLSDELKKTIKQPSHCVAVTGTNGKSSVVHFLHQIWSHAGKSSASLGTLGLSCYENETYKIDNLTTQDPICFYNLLLELKSNNIEYLAYEASSHGIAQHRTDFCTNAAVAFTNLSQDHLDYHQTMDDYFEAKKRLFSELALKDTPKVINGDDKYGIKLSRLFPDNVILFGTDVGFPFSYSDMYINLKSKKIKRSDLSIQYDLHIQNILCACACAYASGLTLNEIAHSLMFLSPPKGRLEEVKPNIVVDYAHTPEGLEKAIINIRKKLKGKLITVFGCGGNRDQTKRQEMGKIASSLSDTVIITDDNPRFENPTMIMNEILSGCEKTNCSVLMISPREKAIETALSLKNAKDVVLIAGKGHEESQEIQGVKHPFSDQKTILNLLSKEATSSHK